MTGVTRWVRGKRVIGVTRWVMGARKGCDRCDTLEVWKTATRFLSKYSVHDVRVWCPLTRHRHRQNRRCPTPWPCALSGGACETSPMSGLGCIRVEAVHTLWGAHTSAPTASHSLQLHLARRLPTSRHYANRQCRLRAYGGTCAHACKPGPI